MPSLLSYIRAAAVLLLLLDLGLIHSHGTASAVSIRSSETNGNIANGSKATKVSAFLGNPYEELYRSYNNIRGHASSGTYDRIRDLNGHRIIENHRCNAPRALHRTFGLMAKPVINEPTFSRSSIPKRTTVDYENLLRSHDPEQINYNTRLRDMPGIDFRAIDDIYGRIYDRRVLMKQLRYFLERDEFHSIKRLLSENRYILTRRDCRQLANDVDHLLQVRLGYREPTEENLDETMPFLVGRYVLQHLIPQDQMTLCRYKWLSPKEIPSDVPDYTDDYEEPRGTAEKPIKVEDTVAYRKIMRRLRGVQPYLRLKVMKELFLRMYRAKRTKLFECLWKYQKLKPDAILSRKRKVRNKINVDRISPFLARPPRCTEEMVREHTAHFAEAVDKGDLATACRLLKRYVRRIDWKNNLPLQQKFFSLFSEMHKSRKYNQEQLRKLRILYWSTVKFRKVLIKINEPMMVHEAGKTMKELYNEQLENWRKRRDEKNDALMRKRGVDMDKVRDFSNVYGMDWIPILYPKEYEEGLKAHEARMEKLRKKAEWVADELKRRRMRESGDGHDPVRKKGKMPTLWV